MGKKSFFGSSRTIHTATAPGRLDVMGGIADYSGSLVLEMPIDRATTCSLALRADRRLRIHSTIAATLGWCDSIEVKIDDFLNGSGQPEYKKVKRVLSKIPNSNWAAYVIGCVLVLMQEKRARFKGGDFWIESSLPPGKGVSASAAIEVAVMASLSKALHLNLKKTELPMLCQKAENLVVGAPCGLMDQLTSYLGQKNHLLPIVCQPAALQESLAIPRNIHFIGIDSGVRHAVSGSSYTNVRVAAFMGYSIIARYEGASTAELMRTRGANDCSKLPYHGYLANIPISAFEQTYRKILPSRILGRDFLNEFGNTIDAVTAVQKSVRYDVLACTLHPIYENHRTRLFMQLLIALNQEPSKQSYRTEVLKLLGELMLQSHASYSACGLGNEVTDRIVTLARAAGSAQGIYGAKITGGGSGGTVCLLCEGRRGVATAKQIAQRINSTPVVFDGSRDGAFWQTA